jgi:DNA invertase Pin-like site-specific DNA recombinase
MSKVAVYVRVSTLDQEKGLKSQENALRQYLDGHDVTNAKWYRDRVSGGTLKRPAFEQLQRDIFNGRIKTVVCWKLDRLSRSLRDGINVLTDWIERDVRIVAVSQQLDFSGAVGQAFAALLFAIAQMERENLRENTKRGLLHAQANGVQLGKRPTLFAKDILPLLNSGKSVAEAARLLGKTRQAIYTALKREGTTVAAGK